MAGTKLGSHKVKLREMKRSGGGSSQAKRARVQSKGKMKKAYIPRSVLVARGQTFPQEFKTTLRYAVILVPSFSSGTITHLFSCNGLYDPNITGAGHQPLYFDQMMTLYNHYTVTGSKITVEVCDVASYNMVASIYIDDDTTVVSNAAEAMERPGAVYCAYSGGGIGTSRPKLTKRWSLGNTFGQIGLANPSTQGDSSGNPTEQSYYVIHLTDPSGGRTGSTMVNVLIEYTATFTELKTVAQS